jgi:hypothetical protein
MMSTLPSARSWMRLLGVLVRLEPTQRLDADGEAAEPLQERRQVLLNEQRRGHQHGDLLAVLDCLECRPERDLGLAVADITADEAVHGDRFLHVRS